MTTKTKLTLAEKINRARDGRSQKWIVKQMNDKGIKINDVQFSRKKSETVEFTVDELKALQEILETVF